MPPVTANAKLFRDWESAIGATDKNPDLLPGAEPFKSDLQASLANARDLKIQQEDLAGKRKAITQQLAAVKEGANKARKLRAFVVSQLGADSEHLTQWGIKPIGKKRPKALKAKPAQKVPEPPPVQEEKEGAPQKPATP
jgi:outer membrane murein-binding lipoprotein Lpp